MRIENEFLPYNLTKKLIELGYKRNGEALGGFYKYNDEDRIFFMTAAEEATSSIHRDTKFEEIDAILWQQAFKWFHKKGFGVFIETWINGGVEKYRGRNNYPPLFITDIFNTYEEAREACLIKMIDLYNEED